MKSSLALVLLTGTCLGLDAGIVAPSLAKYLESLNCGRGSYGLLVSLFWISRLFALPLFGLYIDSRPYKNAFCFAFALGSLGGICYALAPLGEGVVWIALSRVLLGASSAVGVVSSGYIGSFVAKEEMTQYVSIKGGVRGVTSAMSPAFNILFVALPTYTLHGVKLVSSHTYCGYFIAAYNLVLLLLFCAVFQEPQRVVSTPESLSEPLLLEEEEQEETMITTKDLLRRILYTGAWISFVTSIQNNFHQQAVQWSIPLTASDEFGWGQLENGYIFAMVGVVGVISTTLVAFVWSPRLSDRTMYVLFQLLLGAGLFGFLLSSIFGVSRAVFLACIIVYYVGNESQIAGNIAIYVKLVGKTDQGKAQAILQMLMCLSKFTSGLILGVAETHSMVPLWIIVLSVWSAQFPVLCCMWQKISPDRIAKVYDTPSLHYRVSND